MVQIELGDDPVAASLSMRPYQDRCLAALVGYRRNRTERLPDGGRRGLVHMATGTGKTVLFSHIPRLSRGRVLAMAHREELVDQIAGTMRRVNPDSSVGVEQAGRTAPGGCKVVVASVQTLAMSPDRLNALDPSQFSVVITDEAHHYLADTYFRVLGHFGVAPDLAALKARGLKGQERKEAARQLFKEFRPPAGAPFLAGFTATPARADGLGLEYLFDDIVFSYGIQDAILDGWLCPVRGLRVYTGASLEGVRTRGGDFAEGDLSRAVNTEKRNEHVVKAYLEHASGRRALAFAVDRQHAQDLFTAFLSHRIKAGLVLGNTREPERRAVIAAFRAGEVDVLVNCEVLTEGFDSPECSCIIMARPTKSAILYTQMMGRATRIAPGKEDMLVLDMADAGKAGVVSANTLFGLPPKLDPGGEDLMEVTAQAREYEEQVPQGQWDEVRSLEDLRQAVDQFDPLVMAGLSGDVARGTCLAWLKIPSGFVLAVPASQGYAASPPAQLGVVEDLLGHAALRVKEGPGASIEVGGYPGVVEAMAAAEQWVQQHRADSYSMLRRDASWRTAQENATPGQAALLRRLQEPMPVGLTKGQASVMIDRALTRKKRRS